jgi:UPF0755 protein
VPDSRGRTREEREAARRERELRRAGVTDRTALAREPEPDQDGAELQDGDALSDGAQDAPSDGLDHAPSDGFDGELSEGFDDEPPDELGEASRDEPHADEFFADPTEEHEAADEDVEVPAGTRRVSRLTHPRSTRQRKRSVKPVPTPKAGRRRHSRMGRLASLVALVLAAAGIWLLWQLFQPFHGSPHGSVTVTVPADTSASQVGDLLAREGVISSSFFFELRATLAGERDDLRPGTYHLQLGMSYGSVLSTLTTPPHAAKVTELTITEGRTRHQIDALLRSQHVRGSYFDATRHSRLINPRRYGAPARTNSLEGFLFPSTYQLVEPIRINTLVADQLRAFRQEFAKVNLGYARR